ncbi:right-handed parallel beta-helix repeat-containing protein [Hyalangium versicolor]|uniref:right-handed parallel beta-helix repeat-containing protein n=1 Tax=Hyalangium versicolor TaxID=2861190 RepID=UPI001CCACD9F|nr:right-handed parallel beta-helix repeat-containing protein [Hyalangium versicolor]
MAHASDDGIGAQNRPNLAFAELAPTRIFHVAVTGSDGNAGTAASPWRTINYAATRLRAGEAAYVHAGTYSERVVISSNDGTASAPIQLLGAPNESRPVIRGGDSKSGAMIRITRSYWVISGFDIQTAGSQTYGVRFDGAHSVVVRGTEVSGGTGPAAVVFHNGATDIGFLQNKVHDYTFGSNDSHGLLVLPDTARILIQGNESWGNGGDAFQCQGTDTASGTALPIDVTVENNRFHEDHENAVDIKTCDRVTVRGNKFYGYRPVPTAPQGDAMVVHCSARRILVEGNRLWNNGRGLAIGGTQILSEPVTDVIIRRNLFFDNTTSGGGKGEGLNVGTSRRVRVHHNTFFNIPVSAIRVAEGENGPPENTELYNNVISTSPRAIDVALATTVGFKSNRNLAYQSGTDQVFRVDGRSTNLSGWRSATQQDGSSIVADPLFVSDPRNNDFYTQPGSPARDVALPLTIPSPPLLSGQTCGTGLDLGFLESCS